MPFRPTFVLNHLRYPSTLSLFGLTSLRPFSSPQGPHVTCTRFLPRHPSPAAPRESPTPLILVRARGLSQTQDNEETWVSWSSMFAEKGYTAVEIDITPPPYSQTPFPSMVSALSGQIRLMGIPFPPVLIASGVSCLLTQGYVEDNPVSGLVLVNPPPDADIRSEKEQSMWTWPTFKYEPTFPILIMGQSDEAKGLEKLKEVNRVARAVGAGVSRGGKGVSIGSLIDGERGEKSRNEVERWMDSCGY